MRYLILFAILACFLAGLTSRLANRFGDIRAAPVPDRDPPTAARASQPVSASPRTVTVRRDHFGNFQVEGAVEGHRLAFIVDTGASVVTLNSSDAARLGLHPGPRDYTLKLTTANGAILAAPVELATLEIGDIVVRQVRAVIVPTQALGKNLLGLTFLSRLRRFEYRDGRLLLEE
jgi:aspartyl protease family protein